MSFGRVEISGGALLILALLYYLDRDNILLWVLASSLLHEAGHWWAIRWLGGEVQALRLSCAGAELSLSPGKPLPPGRMVLAALAGPAVNFLLAFVSIRLARHGAQSLYLFAGINLGLGLFNLLPVRWLDGGRALENVLELLGLWELGECLSDICSRLVVCLLLLGGFLLLWESEGKNFTLLIAGLWMLNGLKSQETDDRF